MINRKELKKLNAPIVAKPMLPAMSERLARRKATQALATGKISKEDAKNVESAHRNSRRVNAKINKHQIHTDQELTDDFVEVGEVSAEAGAAKNETKLTHAVEGSSGARREAQLAHPIKTESGDLGAARESFGDGIGIENDADSDTAASSGEVSRLRALAGRHFKQTDGISTAAAKAARAQEIEDYNSAWEDFKKDPKHGDEASEIDKVWDYQWSKVPEGSGIVPVAIALRDAGKPTKGFKRALDQFLSSSRVRPKARPARRNTLEEAFRQWWTYRKCWRRPPDPSELDYGQAEPNRYAGVHSLPGAIASLIRGGAYGQRQAAPEAIRAPNPWVAAWEAEGMPLWGGELINLDGPTATLMPLDLVMRQADETARWEDSPLRARAIENRARADWWNMYRLHKPRPPRNSDDDE